MIKITVIGAGYVGLVSGACLADFGNYVICVDTDSAKVEKLKQGIIPIYESGLDELVSRNMKAEMLSFSTEFSASVLQSNVVFIAVGTPPLEDGSADLKYVESVARGIGRCMEKYTIIVDKSTVPVGVGKQVKKWVAEELEKRGLEIPFDIVSNPEFLREGTAVYDFTHPDRVVIGSDSDQAKKIMKDVYHPLYLNETPYLETNLESAEMIKYASNAFLSVKIAFINEIANLCEKVGADISDVANGVGRDKRIGPQFLAAGPGYGGSCFPKDTQALAAIGRFYESPISIVECTIASNKKQKSKMVDKIESGMGGKGSIRDKIISILGLAFKNNTNDMRESPAIDICTELVKRGAKLKVWDPAAMSEAAWQLKSIEDSLYFASNTYDTLEGADALVLLTEWPQFGNLDLERVKKLLRLPYFFDLRNMYKKQDVESVALKYFGVGK
ncbi:UDP-glucose 6-dehydrogenase [Spirochaetia bacterium]|nr:UDP-glucose 6-dehydrogenase [Spirochaetia bacterium]